LLVNWLAPAAHLISAGDRLLGPGTSLRIVRGCDGAGVLVLLVGAILAYPVRWHQRAFAAVGATLFVYLLNEFRLVALCFASAHSSGAFTVLHVYVLPTLLVMACAIYFVVWSGRVEPEGQP
jgi:exosortase family protein XrtM